MAIATPKKPRKVQAVKTPGSTSSAGAVKPYKSSTSSGFSGSVPTVTKPNTPAAPALATPPTPVVTPPILPSVQTTADRNTARYDYSTTMGDVNQQLRTLAQQYGGAPNALQYGYGEDGKDTQSLLDVTANAPGSTLETLARNLAATKQNVDETNNANNTFFGSYRLGQLTNADSDYQGQLGSAKRAYDDAVARLTTAIQTARGTRNTNLTNADIADQQAAMQVQPQAQATAPYDPLKDPNIDWNAVKKAFGGGDPPKPTLSAGGSHAQVSSSKKKPKKK